MEQITSFQNPKIKQVKRLRDRRHREREARFVIDEVRDLERALDQGYRVDYALYCADLGPVTLLERVGMVYDVPRSVLEKVSYRQNPAPIVAVIEQATPPDTINLAGGHPVLVLVGLTKPGNIGALLRTADAAGFKTILLVDTALDLYNPNIIRSSTGACFLHNIHTPTADEALRLLRENDYRLVAAAVDGNYDLFDADLSGRVAVVLGTEDQGLDAAWLAAAEQRIRIPMCGTLSDSLNVSVSGAIFMYEALRQHR
jgi:RNA methyltransferase, TrmH family